MTLRHAASRVRLSDFRWTLFLIWAWSALGMWAYATDWLPASYWLEVDRIEVMDGVVGEAPPMEVDRTIKRPFRAGWIVTAMRQSSDGTFYTFCTAFGRNDYRPGNGLPEDLDLDWWTWPQQCELPQGTYYLNTIWMIRPERLSVRELRVSSDVFTVLPAQSAPP